MILAVIIAAVLVSIGMLLLRAFLGSSPFDRILASNSLGTHVAVFIVLLGLFNGSEHFIDIAIVYALVSFVSTVAFLMYFKYRKEE